MTTPFNFSAGAVLTAAQLNEIGKYHAYTPTWGSITLGSGGAAAVSDAMYAQVNKVTHASGTLTFGSGTSITGNVTMSLPFTAADAETAANGCKFGFYDASTTVYYQGAGRTSSTSAVFVYAWNAAGTYLSLSDIADNTKPFPATWTTGDKIIFNIVYEAA